MKEDFNYISYWLRRYLVEYMISIRNLSKNTQLSYRDTYRMVLSFVGKYLRKDVDLILVSDITPDIIKTLPSGTGIYTLLQYTNKKPTSCRGKSFSKIYSISST